MNTRLCKTIAMLLLCGITVSGCSNGSPEFRLGMEPSPTSLIKLLFSPEKPFVAVNFLTFKEEATGADYEGMTGWEAYQLYGESAEAPQSDISSRMIWSGEVLEQVKGDAIPGFHLMAFLEYQKPSAFLQYAASPDIDLDARKAGLLGQWNIVAYTNEENDPTAIAPESGDAIEVNQTLADATGYSVEQLESILRAEAGSVFYLIELIAYSDNDGTLYQPYRNALDSAINDFGGAVVWRGKPSFFLLGTSAEAFHEIQIIAAPNPETYIAMLTDANVVAQASARDQGLNTQWVYTAKEAVAWE